WGSFAHTVLVDMRARLRRSTRPDRIFEVGLEAAHAAGLVGRRRVLDSTPLYDAVATMDTVTLIRSAVRGVLAGTDAELAAVLRSTRTRRSSPPPRSPQATPATPASPKTSSPTFSMTTRRATSNRRRSSRAQVQPRTPSGRASTATMPTAPGRSTIGLTRPG